MFSILFLFALASFLIGGCASVGPSSVKRDRLHYATAVAQSWKEQLLLNIVKSCYGDAPLFLDVTSVVSGYSLESKVGGGLEWHPNDPEDFFTLGGSSTYTDRPTVSYAPMTGEKFARSLMAPVPLDTLLFVLQQRVPADFILGLTLESMEGHQNAITYSVGLIRKDHRPADPSFIRVLKLITELQQERTLSTEVSRSAMDTTLHISFDTARAAKQGLLMHETELKKLLGIPGASEQVEVVFGSRAPAANTIAIRTRSLLQMIATLGAGVQIPQEHLLDGSALETGSSPAEVGFSVYSGRERPTSSFVAVPHEGLWFWIDRRDYATKSTLTALTVLFNFLEGGGSQTSPVLTIPTQ